MSVSKIENCSEVCRRDSLWISQDDACKSRIHVTAFCPIWSLAGIPGKLMIVAQKPNSPRTPWILGDIQRSYVTLLAIFRFTTTERILARRLLESYRLWQYRPWKWRNIFRETSQETKNKRYYKKQIDNNYTLIDHRNDTIKFSKLCSETTRLRLVVPLEFWTFYDVTSVVYKSVDHRKLWSIC